MSQRRLSYGRLAHENAELRARLAEAEETLHAIRTGEVDALLVSGVGGDQVFTLKGADHAYRMLIEDMNEGALTLTTDGVILYANRRFAEMLKAPLEQVIGSAIHTWIAPADYELFEALLQRDTIPTRCRGEIGIRASDGAPMPGYFSTTFSQTLGLFCLVVTDLTEQKRKEHLTAALHQNEVLLKEIHHRIKNNLQVVMSLLRIQSREVSDLRAKSALDDSCQRVKMMALAHELLYRTGDMATINAEIYLQQISTQLTQIYDRQPGQVTLSVVAEGIWLSMDQAVPCGLIINELLSNSLKYAFPDGQCGTIGIALHAISPGILTLRVWDTGVGFPVDNAVHMPASFGIALVHDLVRQLRGTMVTEHATGVSVSITFPHDLAA